MEGIENFGLFVMLSWLLIISPGPDTLFVIAKSIADGKHSGLLAAIGVTIGILVHTLFASLGLSLILQTSATAFIIVKYAGATYLVWMGVQALIQKGEWKPKDKPSNTTGKTLRQAILTNVLNPKVALFFMAFLPQFVSSTFMESSWPFILLGLIFAFFTLCFLIVLALLSSLLGEKFLKNGPLSTYPQKVSGLIFIGLGIRLAFLEKD